MMRETDFLVVGAGIAGAGIAYHLAQSADVIIIDMEEQAGYHTTGRSAAFYAETYGGPKVQPLTTASKQFLLNPPEDFADRPILTNLGAVYMFREDQRAFAEAFHQELATQLPDVSLMSKHEVLEKAPYLKPDNIAGGIADPDCGDLDVAALHQGYLRGAKKRGADLLLDTGFEKARYDGESWIATTRSGDIKARVIVNASGAWADKVAEHSGVNPIGVKPLRRTIVTVPNPDGLPFDRHGPVVFDVEEAFYFKPEGDGYLLTPADEVLTEACDVQPELEDIAVAVNYFEQATGTSTERVDAKWAGLRTFAADRAPVIGYDENAPGFFWNAGQGGFGIQTAPAWSLLAANLAQGKAVPDDLLEYGVKAEQYSPARFVTS